VRPRPVTPKNRRTSEKTLRSKAEKILLNDPQPASELSEGDTDTRKLIHELQAHQIELEMQNDELRKKQEEIEEIRKRYVDLYDFAPVGYFTFDRTGKIVEVNLTGASLLGLPRSRLIGRPFTFFVENGFISLFHTHLAEVFSSELDQTSELKIRQSDTKSLIYVSLRSMAERNDEEMKCRSAVMDITDRKLAEEKTREVYEALAKANEQLHCLSNRLLTVQEEERKRISLEVHDGFASSLSAIKYKLQDIPLELRKQYDLEELSSQLEAAIGEARRIQAFLRPPALDDLGIGPALNWLCREFQKNYPDINIEKRFQLGEDKIPDSITIAIYRITQEALDNTASHSKANRVSLSLTKKNGFIDLVILDNGQGFDVETTLYGGGPQRGFGLSSMKERAALSGGSLHIQSASTKGTTIRASWPVDVKGGFNNAPGQTDSTL